MLGKQKALTRVALFRASPATPTPEGVRKNDVKQKVCDFGSLYKAMRKCKKNVMWKDSVAGYVKNGLINCYKLNKQLMDGTYTIDRYTRFTIYEPKKREIASTKFKDRVFQRSLCDNYLYETITKSFIYDSGACQVGRGTDFSRKRLVRHMQQYFKAYGLEGYVLCCDIKDYFGSTSHAVAKEILRKRVGDDWAYDHVVRIIDTFSQKDDPGVGIGLGSQVTQLIQLAILDDLDHFIKEVLGIKFYIRYMDDFILIHPDKEYLKYCKGEIGNQLTKLGLRFSQRKTQIHPLKQGIKFLGFTFYLIKTRKVIKRLNKENIADERRKLKKLKALVHEGILTKEHVDECFESWKAHAKRDNGSSVITKMNRFYNNLWGDNGV